MAFTQKDNTGAIFKNDKRETDNHPHAKGTATIDGVEYYISAWTRDDKHGGKYQSLAFKRKDAKPAVARTADDPRTAMDDDDAEIPF